MIKKYNKLVRDKIPEIIERDGKDVEIKILDRESRLEYLNKKLVEEVDEYLEDGSMEELADIQEVIYGILELKGTDKEDLERIRLEKRNEKGGFKKGILLEKVIE